MLIFSLSVLISFMSWSQSPATIATIAKVADQVITTRDLQINQFLNEFDNPLSEYADKKDPLKTLTWEFLIFKESEAVVDQGVSDSDVASYQRQFKKKMEKDQLWKSMQVGDKALAENIRRKLVVKRLLNIKMPMHLVAVDEASVESYYALQKAQLGHRPLSEVKEQIIKGLKEQKMQERFKDWIAAISRTHGVTYFSGYKIQ